MQSIPSSGLPPSLQGPKTPTQPPPSDPSSCQPLHPGQRPRHFLPPPLGVGQNPPHRGFGAEGRWPQRWPSSWPTARWGRRRRGAGRSPAGPAPRRCSAARGPCWGPPSSASGAGREIPRTRSGGADPSLVGLCGGADIFFGQSSTPALKECSLRGCCGWVGGSTPPLRAFLYSPAHVVR